MTSVRPPELLIATGNVGKVREFASLLADLPVRLRRLREFPHVSEVEETGRTFAENAALKAAGYAAQTELWTLADDSGLEVEALGNAPGVFSARYGGIGLTDAERTQRLLTELATTGDAARRARFVCVIAVADAQARIVNVSTGVCAGHIAHAPRGAQGFGYDPIFIPERHSQSFGELPPDIKHGISHRSRALLDARAFLLNRLAPEDPNQS